MRRFIRSALIALLASAACLAVAQARRSPRNPAPLRPRPGAEAAQAKSGETGLGVAVSPLRSIAPRSATTVTFSGPTNGWGFVRIGTPHFTLDGKNLGPLPGGTLFTYAGVRISSRNPMLVARIKRGDAWEGPVLIDCADVAAYEGAPEALDPQLIQNLGDYYRLEARLAEARAAAAAARASEIPELLAAREARQAYLNSIQKAAALEKEADGLTGIRKTRALEEMRRLKYDQVRLKAQADQSAAAFAAWRAANPDRGVEDDPKVRDLETALNEARSKVGHLIPPEKP